jgi:hypothetical protein
MSKKSRKTQGRQTALAAKQISVDRATFFQAVDTAGEYVGAQAQKDERLRGGIAATMLALFTLAVLDGKPLNEALTVRALPNDVIRTIEQILLDTEYQLGPAFPFTREEMRAEIARENGLDWEEMSHQEEDTAWQQMEAQTEEGAGSFVQQGSLPRPQEIVEAEKAVSALGKAFHRRARAVAACAFLAFTTFIFQPEKENPPASDEAVNRLLSKLARKILEEDGYQPGWEFPFTKQETSTSTRHTRASNKKRGRESLV